MLNYLIELVTRAGHWGYLVIFLDASWQLAAGWIGKASAILGGILVFALSLVWLWRWAMRHEAMLRLHGLGFYNGPVLRLYVDALSRN